MACRPPVQVEASKWQARTPCNCRFENKRLDGMVGLSLILPLETAVSRCYDGQEGTKSKSAVCVSSICFEPTRRHREPDRIVTCQPSRRDSPSNGMVPTCESGIRKQKELTAWWRKTGEALASPFCCTAADAGAMKGGDSPSVPSCRSSAALDRLLTGRRRRAVVESQIVRRPARLIKPTRLSEANQGGMQQWNNTAW